jgi:hypothetical protein
VVGGNALSACTARYADTNADNSLGFGTDLQEVFDALPSSSGQPGWKGPNEGITVDVQGNNPSAIPDGTLSFGTDLQTVFDALPSSGGAPFLGETCPTECP